jgi:peroxiredoxin
MAASTAGKLRLGDRAPAFTLPDVVSGGDVALADLADRKALLVTFICRHCPYVKHVERELARLGRDYGSRGVGIVAIGANDAERYPDDAPDGLREQARAAGFPFPYCHDATQETARAYGAVCTPDTFVFDGDRRLVYRGQLDDSRPGSGTPVTARDLRAALDAVLAGQPVNPDQKPSVGCSIKWKPGNAPG